jgi:porin
MMIRHSRHSAGFQPHGPFELSRLTSAILLACAAASASAHAGVTEQDAKQDPERPMFWEAGQALQSWGITPTLVLTQMVLSNPSAGQQTGNHQALTLVAVGADVDLAKAAGIPGATIHFQQLFAPSVVNGEFGGQVGDSIAGQPMPYIPKKAHLMLLTWEQRFLQDRLVLEVGKSNAQRYFGLPVCELPFGCFSPVLANNAAINPPPYANWSARVAYKPTANLTVQTGLWRSDSAFPFSNGWERSRDTPQSNTYLANLIYKTDPAQDRYAKQYEFLFFHNTAAQANPAYTVSGASRIFNPTQAAASTKGTKGIYYGGKRVVWRADGSDPATPGATSLSVFENVATTLDKNVATGLQTTATLGVTLKGLMKRRPFDSVSARLIYTRLTRDEQQFLRDANLAAGGTGYQVGRNEYAIGLDATIIATPNLIISPYVQRTFNTNTWLNPYYAGKPRDGVVAGVIATVVLDKMLGLSGH